MKRGVQIPFVLEFAVIAAVVMVFWDHPVLKPWLGGAFMAVGLVQLLRLAAKALGGRVWPAGRWSRLNAVMSSVGLVILGVSQVWANRGLEVTGLIVALGPVVLTHLTPKGQASTPSPPVPPGHSL